MSHDGTFFKFNEFSDLRFCGNHWLTQVTVTATIWPYFDACGDGLDRCFIWQGLAFISQKIRRVFRLWFWDFEYLGNDERGGAARREGFAQGIAVAYGRRD
jgi:hypothetical protein